MSNQKMYLNCIELPSYGIKIIAGAAAEPAWVDKSPEVIDSAPGECLDRNRQIWDDSPKGRDRPKGFEGRGLRAFSEVGITPPKSPYEGV